MYRNCTGRPDDIIAPVPAPSSAALMRRSLPLLLALGVTACASVPPVPPAPVAPTFHQKMAWLLRLEDQRVLRDPPAPPPAPPPLAPKGKKVVAPVVVPPPPPDLVRLLSDSEARVRRRAALAIGHVGLRDGVQPLIALLRDEDGEVRQMAAFALGLIGDPSARDPLISALADTSRLVQASAAEALGLIGDPAAAAPIRELLKQIVASGALTPLPGDDADGSRDTAVGAFRLGVYALVRLKSYNDLAAAVLDASGQPRVRWWPVAYALQRLEDPRAVTPLLSFARESVGYARSFAIKGLGALKNRAAVPVLLPLLASGDRMAIVEVVRSLGRIGDPSAVPPLIKLLEARDTKPQLRLEIINALGGFPPAAVAAIPGVTDDLLDAISSPTPAIRAAALRASSTLDPEGFLPILSSLDPDPDWSVRAGLAEVLAKLPPDAGLPRLQAMLNDGDQRVIPAVLRALIQLKAPGIDTLLTNHLKAADPVVRATAATGLGDLKIASAVAALAQAYGEGQSDPVYTARAAVLAALAKFGPAAATPVLRTALADKDWAIRVRAAMLLKELDPSSAGTVDAAIRPAPATLPPDRYQADRIVTPPFSTQLFIDTDRGTIQIELAVLDAPLTVESFVTLARRGFFDGQRIHRVVPDFVVQAGDPRGDGEGGPGYTTRDEMSERAYVRGTVGVALDPWRDTGGSQFFITHSPQPHLDAKYTVFGRVIGGMDVVDSIEQWDVIRKVRVWDGETPPDR